MKNNLFLFLLFVFLQNESIGQIPAAPKRNYVDSLIAAMHVVITDDEDIDSFAGELTEPFKTDSEKVRAIYYWMTQHIAYDYNAFLTGKDVPYKGDEEDYYDRRIVKTLATKKGVCEDYALVFKRLCTSAGIKCEMVIGYALVTRPIIIDQLLVGDDTSNHAWNAVMINKKWCLIDVTFASGYIIDGRFKRKQNDFYYLTSPQDFILDHHPSESSWQLLDHPLSTKEFIKNARYRDREK